MSKDTDQAVLQMVIKMVENMPALLECAKNAGIIHPGQLGMFFAIGARNIHWVATNGGDIREDEEAMNAFGLGMQKGLELNGLIFTQARTAEEMQAALDYAESLGGKAVVVQSNVDPKQQH